MASPAGAKSWAPESAGLQPRTLQDDNHAVQWSFWAMTEVENPLIEVLMHRMFLPAEARDSKAAEARGSKAAEAGMAKLQGRLG